MSSKYAISQTADYLGRDQWRWAVWIEAADGDLARVTEVTWKLHHTFPQPIVTVTDRSTKYRLEQIGWGTFDLRAEVKLQDGEVLHLSHDLQLHYPDSEMAARTKSAMERKPRVYLSYVAEDLKIASAVKRQLVDAGLQVTEPKDLRLDLPLSVGLQKQISDADALVTIVASGPPSRWAATEVATAEKARIPVFSLMQEGAASEGLPVSGTVVQFKVTGSSGTMQAPELGQLLASMRKISG